MKRAYDAVVRWLVAAVVVLVPSLARAQCQSGWLSGPPIPVVGNGTNGIVRAAISWDPDGAGPLPPVLVVGGFFTTVGGTTGASNVAMWNGSAWQAMGSGMAGTGSTVLALAVFNNQLIAAGTFTSAGGVAANNIAAWNGSSWQPLGSGLTSAGTVSVRALAVYSGQLYASGSFGSAGGVALTGMARWNGASWSSAPAGGDSGAYAMTVYNNELYAGGQGSFNGSVTLYRFNGASWFTTPGPIIGTIDPGDLAPSIRALTVFQNKLIVGGNFHDVGSFIGANGIASWDGGASTWATLSTGMNAPVYALTVQNGLLYAGGAFTTAGNVLSTHVASWGGGSWAGTATSMTGSGTLSVLAICGHNGDVVAGGNFAAVNGVTAGNLARFITGSSRWVAVNTVAPVRVFQGAITAGGDFSVTANSGIGIVTAQRCASWDGSQFFAFNDQGGFTGPNGPVFALGTYNPNPFLIGFTVFGGSFSSAGGSAVNNLATWRLSSWGTLGTGFNGTVRALVNYNGGLYAAGDFTAAGGVACAHIAKYISGVWQPVPTAGGFNGTVNTLFVYGGRLYAGGTFTTAGASSINYLASYNGGNWETVADGLFPNGTGSGVYCLTSYSAPGDVNSPYLVLGGKFVTNFNSVPNLARAGSLVFAMSGFGSGINDTVRAATIYQGDLVIGGDFTATPGGAMNHIARDGLPGGSADGWHAMGLGVDGPVYALQPAFVTELHVGGAFSTAGGFSSPSWARWNGTGRPAILGQPNNPPAACNATITVTPIASYTGLTYQWQRNGANLSNGTTTSGSVVSGATTATLTLSNLSSPDQGAYRCLVSNACGTTTSNAANLSVFCCGSADFNGDGDFGTDADIEAFFACLAGNCCATCGSADFNADGDIGTDADIEAFFRVLGGGTC
jgi:Immunoglobulin domain